MKPLIAASLLAADYARLGEEMKAADRAGADWLHMDIMDGHFVPGLSFGPETLRALRAGSKKPVDVHLMVSRPGQYVADFARAGADCLSWHLESDERPESVLTALKAFPRIKKGVALKPATPLSRIQNLLKKIDIALVMTVEPGMGGQKFMAKMLPKVAELKRLRSRLGLQFLIEIDGGVDVKSAPAAIEAGVDVMVAGTSVFGKSNYRNAIRALKNHV